MKTKIKTIGELSNIITLALITLIGTACLNRSDAHTTSYEVLNDPIVITDSIASTPVAATDTSGIKKIKVALLMDTSNSMDGLIDQAKAQLWKIVNELSKARYGDIKPELEIALYEYGNDNLPSSEGYIRQVTLFTKDLDKISEQLFALHTRGGNEFCGQVIHTAMSQLSWAKGDDLQMIFIAGNEPFTQGQYSYAKACREAASKGVIVNTIFCGNFDEGVNTSWKTGADFTGGNYMSIEQDRKTVYIESPYDKDIALMNESLNNTYVSYGKKGSISKSNQTMQDNNSLYYGKSNNVERVISKSSHVYRNESWDLVDASEQKGFDIEKISDSDLPAELKGKTKEQKLIFIAVKKKERETVKQKIAKLSIERSKYIAEEERKKGNLAETTLDAAMLKAVKTKAISKNFRFE